LGRARILMADDHADLLKKGLILGVGRLVWLSLPVLLCSFSASSQQPPMNKTASSALADSQETQASVGLQRADHQAGSISGKVVDQAGANIAGAVVSLAREGQSSGLKATSNEDGLFAFSNVTPGPFQLTISSPGLASQEFSGTLQSGEAYVTPLIMLVITTQVTEVHVGLTPEQLADVQIKEQVKQRVFGVIRTSMSATTRIPLLSRRNTSLSLRGNRPVTRSRLSGLGSWRELARPEIVGAGTDRERKDMQSAMAQLTPMFLPQHLSEAR
jgi:hypothetical protein